MFFAGLLLDCWLIVVNYEAMAETVFLGARQQPLLYSSTEPVLQDAECCAYAGSEKRVLLKMDLMNTRTNGNEKTGGKDIGNVQDRND